MSDKQGHVLVVDDHETSRLKISQAIIQEGYTVDVAKDGRQALKMLRAQPFDLVLLDVIMPEIDGFQVLQQMKNDNQLRDIPVIVVSAQQELSYVVKGVSLGAEDYLPKNFDSNLLRERIDAFLGQRQSMGVKVDVNSLQEIARTSTLFSSTTNDEMEFLASISERRILQAKETLFTIGSRSDHLFLILKGLINIHVPSQDGEVIVARLKSGEVIGEMGIDGRPRTATASAAEPSELVAIHRTDFNKFLKQFPRYYRILLDITTDRLRHTNLMVSEMVTADGGVGAQPDEWVNPSFQTTICGYGRYGKLHIGPKYAKTGYLWEVVAIIDPVIKPGDFAVSVLGRKRPDTLIFNSFDDWHNGYFKRLSKEQQNKQVIEIPLRPDLIYEQTLRYIEAGVKQFILPKPVVLNEQQLIDLTEAVAANQVKAAVASQWHYSDFPKIIQREIRHIAHRNGQQDDLKLRKVEVEFSKENGIPISTTPPLSELPHVLQLLESIGLVDFAQHAPEVSGTETLVDLVYRPDNIEQGVYVRADLDWQPHPNLKQKYPNWDVQKRVLKIFFDNNKTEPELEIDFWIKFARSGDLVIRPGEYSFREGNGSEQSEFRALNFIEDQLLNMNRKIYAAFQQPFEQFQADPNVLSLERYQLIGKQLMLVQAAWESVKDSGDSITVNDNGV